ncbi:MAG: UDP-N-acetylglucosamine 2-epimerase, partial [Nitrospinota bacterium]
FGFLDYIKLQKNAFCILSDSGTITEEAALLNLPAVMIRQAHERPEGMDAGVLIMGGLNKVLVLQAIDTITQQYLSGKKSTQVPDYEMDDVSRKVVRIILSYVDYVNRTVWSKLS